MRKKDALRWANLTETEADRWGLPSDVKLLEQLTLAELLTRYRKSVVPTKKGRDVETHIVNAFLRHPIADTRLADLSSKQFASYRDERLETVTPPTINRNLPALLPT